MYAVFGRRRAVTAASAPTAWMSALDRFARSVHRFHDRVEVIPDRQLRCALQEPGAELDTALASARSRARTGLMRRDDLAPAVRVLLRAGTLCAHATESAVAAATASRNRDIDAAAHYLDDVRAVVHTLVTELCADAPGSFPGKRGAGR